MLPDSRPIAFTVERIINHIYMMYPILTRQDVTRLVKTAIIAEKSSFMNEFNEPVGLRYYDETWLALTDLSLHTDRQFRLPLALANIYLYGTLDRYHHFDPTPYRIDEKSPHRCRRCKPVSQEDLLDDIERYFGGDRHDVGDALSSLLYVRKSVKLETDYFQIDLTVDDLSYPAISVTRLNYGHLAGGEPRKKFTHYDLRQIIDFMRYSRKP